MRTELSLSVGSHGQSFIIYTNSVLVVSLSRTGLQTLNHLYEVGEEISTIVLIIHYWHKFQGTDANVVVDHGLSWVSLGPKVSVVGATL